MTELFSQRDVDHILDVCRQRAKPYGLTFGELPRLSNSHLALEAAEFARAQEKYEDLHGRIFEAYFSHGRDIGDRTILRKLATDSGLDPDEMEKALDGKIFSEQVSQGSNDARKLKVTAIPTFFIEGAAMPITGAVHEDAFRKVLQGVSGHSA